MICRMFSCMLMSMSAFLCFVPHTRGSFVPASYTRIPPTIFIQHHIQMHHLSSTARLSARKISGVRYAHKEIKFSNEGRAAILNGVNILANAVSVTLGPKGTFRLIPLSMQY